MLKHYNSSTNIPVSYSIQNSQPHKDTAVLAKLIPTHRIKTKIIKVEKTVLTLQKAYGKCYIKKEISK